MPWQIVQGRSLSLLQSFFKNIAQFSDKLKNKEREQCQNQDQDPRWRMLEEMLAQARSNILQLLAQVEPGSAETAADNDAFSVRRWWGSVGGAVFISECLLRALRRFLSNTPEQRGHVPSNSSSDDNEDEDDDDDDDIRIIAQCWEYIHWEEYKQHCSDIASQTFTAPFCTFPWRAPQMENKKKEDRVMWQHWRSGWASGSPWCTREEEMTNGDVCDVQVANKGGWWKNLERFFVDTAAHSSSS